jgi:hypothetical protein
MRKGYSSAMGAMALLVTTGMAVCAVASSHHKTPEHHTTKSTAKTRHDTKTHETKPAPASAAHGATTIPAGGLKVYCGPGKNPLMVRKMTQGAGTTVTVICR